ncbi:MAG TPA: tetratricopeptide repeat protein [Vicinamibacteria bacterium]
MSSVLVALVLAASQASPPSSKAKAPAPKAPSAVASAERQAKAALALLPGQPQAALLEARKALSLTADFEPTAFVRAGRKGEVVEDEYLAARQAYRVHRAPLYETVGLALAASGDPTAALRYLRRAVALDPGPERTLGLVRTLLAQGRGREALVILERAFSNETPAAENVALLEQAVDLVGMPSVQAEIDRIRLRPVAGAEYRDGPFAFPANLRLSTTPVFRLDDAPLNVLYAAEASCRTCSADLQELKRLAAPPARVLLVPENLEQDRALRQVVDLYRYGWPLLLGKGLVEGLAIERKGLLVVGRGGWVGASLKAPWGESLPRALAVLARSDIAETVPRPRWNHLPPVRGTAGAVPGLLPEGLAPGEDAPPPPEFAEATAAFRAGRLAEALRVFESFEARGDGFLLPPEARLNRALCLAGLGRREEARKLLLKTGDSRLQEDVDRALEVVGSPKR